MEILMKPKGYLRHKGSGEGEGHVKSEFKSWSNLERLWLFEVKFSDSTPAP